MADFTQEQIAVLIATAKRCARRELIASLRSFGVDVPGMFDEPSAGRTAPTQTGEAT